ncbi:MAG: DNA-binding transcriptional regulator CytR [Vibrio sp.]
MATMKEVAILAGVSTATVSRALMNPEKVSLATRKRVESAVAESGYAPSTLNRTLRKTESKTIVAILPNVGDPYFADVIKGVQETALAHGYLLLLANCPKNLGCNLSEIDMSLHKQADGMLILGAETSQLLTDDPKSYPPMVMACEYDPELELPTVHIDNLTAAFQAVNYMTQMGHSRVAQISGPKNSTISQFRTQGYNQALRRAGIIMQAEYSVEGNYSFESGQDMCQKLLSQPKPPTAIFCHNDMMAIGAIKKAKQMGFQVPQDISIIGFDNVEFSQYCDPPLTTISQPKYEIGKKAFLLLLETIRGEDVPSGSRLLNADILIRDSVAPPRHIG